MSKLFAEMVQEARESRIPADPPTFVDPVSPTEEPMTLRSAGKTLCGVHIPAAIAEQEEENERAKLLMEGANLWPSAREQWMRLRYGCEPAMQDARPELCRARGGRIYFRDGKSLLLDSIVAVEPADANTNYSIHERVIIRHSKNGDAWGGPSLMSMVIDCADRAERDYLASFINKALQDRGSRPQLTVGGQSVEVLQELAALRVEQGKLVAAFTHLLESIGVEMPK